MTGGHRDGTRVVAGLLWVTAAVLAWVVYEWWRVGG